MSTLIELYDKEPVLNLIAACSIQPQPKTIVFLGDFTNIRIMNQLKLWTENFLSNRGINADIHFMDVDTRDCSEIINALFDIESRYEDCVLEVSGGSDLSLLAAGMFAENTDIPIFRFDTEHQCFCDVRNMQMADKFTVASFSAEEIFELAHAGVTGHGHFESDALDLSVRNDAKEIWYIFLANRTRWHYVVQFFQTAQFDNGNALVVTHCGSSKGLSTKERESVLIQLAEAGLINDLFVSGEHVRFKIKNFLIKSVLQDVGAALEIFTYSCIRRYPNIFNDCEINICVDWDGKGPSKTSSEIDIVAVSEVAPLFISCKSGKLENNYLNELYTITKRFGGMLSKAVLMTADSSRTGQSIWIRQRAQDMGITLIGLNEICPKFKDHSYCGINDCKFCYLRSCESNLANILSNALEC